LRCAVISDIHGNLDALEAVLADAGEVDEIWCLGDLVGYGPQPNECITRLRQCNARCVAGNHDWAATGKLGTAEFNPEASEAARWTQEQLTPEHQAYLDSLPEQVTAGPAGDFTLTHGSPRDPIWEYLTHVSLARLNFDYYQTLYCFRRAHPRPAGVRAAAAGGPRAALPHYRAPRRDGPGAGPTTPDRQPGQRRPATRRQRGRRLYAL
jgi:predicted phosphodiesterase